MKTEQTESPKSVNDTITLTPEQSAKFQVAVKIGLYKELHRKGLLTDVQLKQLISIQNT